MSQGSPTIQDWWHFGAQGRFKMHGALYRVQSTGIQRGAVNITLKSLDLLCLRDQKQRVPLTR